MDISMKQLKMDQIIGILKLLRWKAIVQTFCMALFSISESTYLEKLKITFSGSFSVLLSCRSFYNFFCWTELSDFKILSLIPKKRVLTWTKSIKLSSFCKGTLRKLNSFCKLLKVDFSWRISSLNRLNWQSLQVNEYLRWLFPKREFRKFGITLLSSHKNWRSNFALRKR